MSHKNTFMAHELIKRKCLFFSKCAVQKQIHHLACWSPIPPSLPPLEPCAEMANRRQPSDWLRGRELPSGTAPGSDLHSHMYWWRWVFLPFFFWCRLSSTGICALRAVSTGVPTKQRQAHIKGSLLPIHIRDPLGPQGPPCIDESSWRGNASL